MNRYQFAYEQERRLWAVERLADAFGIDNEDGWYPEYLWDTAPHGVAECYAVYSEKDDAVLRERFGAKLEECKADEV